MRNGKMVLVAVALGLVLCLVLFVRCDRDYDNPQRWRHPSGLPTDPFGHAIFDSIMAETLPKGYHFSPARLPDLRPQEYADQSLLIIADYVNEVDVGCVDSLVGEGCKVLLVSDNIHVVSFYEDEESEVKEAWPIDIVNNLGFSFYDFKDDLNEHRNDTLRWCRQGDAVTDYPLARELVTSEVKATKPSVQVVAECTQGLGTVVRVYGNHRGGALYYVSTPLVMTNYGILDRQLSPLVLRVMSLIADRPVTRVLKLGEVYRRSGSNGDNETMSPLSYFLSRTPLQTALYIALGTLVLLVIFRARRRQRAIPVVKPPVNHSLEFVQIVGDIYYNRGDYANLRYMKYLYFAEELRRRLMIDIDDEEQDVQNFLLLSQKTGLSQEFIQVAVTDARSQYVVEDDEALEIIDKMNNILRRI